MTSEVDKNTLGSMTPNENDDTVDGFEVTEEELNRRGARGIPSKYRHYYKRIPDGVKYIDTYSVNRLFNIDDPTGCTQHAVKKLLVMGGRGFKDNRMDYNEAIVTLIRGGQIRGYYEVTYNSDGSITFKLNEE